MFILNLVKNFALLISMAVIYQVVMDIKPLSGRLRDIAAGLLFGLICMAGMITPVNFAPGIIFDGRSVMLAIAGLFGGPVTALVSALMSAVFRYWIGGAGTVMGILVIAESAALGTVFHYARKSRPDLPGTLVLGLTGVSVHVVMVLLMFVLPGSMGTEMIKQLAAPVMIAYTPATILVGLIFLNQEKKKLAEIALSENERKYRGYVEYAPYGIFVTDDSGNFLEANRKALALTGYGSEELLAKKLTDIINENRKERGEAGLRQLFLNGLYEGEFPFTRKDGRKRVFSVKAVQIDNHRALGFAQDITEKKEAEERLQKRLSVERIVSSFSAGLLGRESYALDDEIMTALSSLGTVTGTDRVYIYMYRNNLETYSNTHEWCAPGVRPLIESLRETRSLDFPWWTERMKANLPVICDSIDTLPAGAEAEKRELRGQEVMSLAAVPVFHEGRLTGFMGFDSVKKPRHWTQDDLDILKLTGNVFCSALLRDQEQKERKTIESHLIQAQKLESVGRLAGGIAHDFNNVLQAILGFTEISISEIDSGNHEKLREFLEEIYSAARRSALLTAQLLAFSRRQPINPVPVNLNHAVESILSMLARLIGEDIRFLWKPGDSLWEVNADISQINQVLTNLTVNARDAISGKSGGEIIIETANVTAGSSYESGNSAIEEGDYVMLAVSDNGCGMDRETLSQMFEPFFTTKGKEGTGLGLSTVYGIVKQNNAFISPYSEPGRGTTIKIYFRKFSGNREQPESAKHAEKIQAGGTSTILVVEDERSILGIAREILQRSGYSVLTAESGASALETADSFEGQIDLLLTDVILPEMNGRELAKAVSGKRPEIRVLYMSGYTANVILHRGVIDEGINFIQKPFSVTDLIARVGDILAGNRQ